MTYLRIWDQEMKLLFSVECNPEEVKRLAEGFMAAQDADLLNATIDPKRGGSFTTRIGCQLVRTETGIEWRDNLRHLTMAPYSLPVNVGPGDKMAIQVGDQLYTDTIESVRMTSPAYVPRPEPSRWQRIRRAITPRRWRKPLWTPPGGSSETVITTIGDGEPYMLGRDILLGERTTWPEIVAQMTQSEPPPAQPSRLSAAANRVVRRIIFGR